MFQSTFPQGERLCPSFRTTSGSVFQSTFPQGERPSHHCLCLTCYLRFNPRSRKGNDQVGDIVPLYVEGFNPRSRKGNDCLFECLLNRGGVSIHVPARGTTTAVQGRKIYGVVSIHVPARGTTMRRRPQADMPQMFQSTFPQGERHGNKTTIYVRGHVSIHVPARGTTRCRGRGDNRGCVTIHVPARGTTKSTLPR